MNKRSAKLPKPYYRSRGITLYRGDCLDVLPSLRANSIDTVITDPPQGLMDIDWDAKSPDWPILWRMLLRLAAPDAAILIFAIEPIATDIITASPCHFRYDLVWAKNIATGFLNCNRMPLRAHERILVFGNGRLRYFRHDFARTHMNRALGTRINRDSANRSQLYGGHRDSQYVYLSTRCATSVLAFPRPGNFQARRRHDYHPTRKPVPLLEWLVQSYVPPGGVVLDPFLGSGTTALACLNTGRRCIGIEKEAKYLRIAAARLKAELKIAN